MTINENPTPCPEVVYYEVGDTDYACDAPAGHAGPHHWIDASASPSTPESPTARPLNVHDLTVLGMIGEAIDNSRMIARWDATSNVPEYGMARAFAHDGGGFLTRDDDVRDGCVWVSAGNRYTERWWPVADLMAGFDRGEVSLDYQP